MSRRYFRPTAEGAFPANGRSFIAPPSRGFSLIELLVVIAVIAVVAALLLPALNKAQERGKRVKCLNNLKQIGVAFHSFAHDHNDKFPMQVSTNSGGTMEFVNAAEKLGGSFFFAFRHFQAVSNELGDPQLLVCPADNRLPAPGFAALQNENVSYFVAPTAQAGHPDSIVAGDRNIKGTWASAGSVLQIGNDGQPGWSQELHNGQGYILFGDARVELLNGKALVAALNLSKGPVTVYLPASSKASGSSAPASATGSNAPASAPRNGGGSGSSTGGKGGGSSGAGNATASGGGALAQLEQVFGGPDKPKPTAPNSPPVMGRKTEASAPEIVASLPPQNPIVEAKGTNRPAATTNFTLPAAPERDQMAGDPWPIGLGQLVTKFSSRGTWLLLLLLLATLITIEVLRRRRARKKIQT